MMGPKAGPVASFDLVDHRDHSVGVDEADEHITLQSQSYVPIPIRILVSLSRFVPGRSVSRHQPWKTDGFLKGVLAECVNSLDAGARD